MDTDVGLGTAAARRPIDDQRRRRQGCQRPPQRLGVIDPPAGNAGGDMAQCDRVVVDSLVATRQRQHGSEHAGPRAAQPERRRRVLHPPPHLGGVGKADPVPRRRGSPPGTRRAVTEGIERGHAGFLRHLGAEFLIRFQDAFTLGITYHGNSFCRGTPRAKLALLSHKPGVGAPEVQGSRPDSHLPLGGKALCPLSGLNPAMNLFVC